MWYTTCFDSRGNGSSLLRLPPTNTKCLGGLEGRLLHGETRLEKQGFQHIVARRHSSDESRSLTNTKNWHTLRVLPPHAGTCICVSMLLRLSLSFAESFIRPSLPLAITMLSLQFARLIGEHLFDGVLPPRVPRYVVACHRVKCGGDAFRPGSTSGRAAVFTRPYSIAQSQYSSTPAWQPCFTTRRDGLKRHADTAPILSDCARTFHTAGRGQSSEDSPFHVAFVRQRWVWMNSSIKNGVFRFIGFAHSKSVS